MKMFVLAPLLTAAVLMVLTIRIAKMESKARFYHKLRKRPMAYFPQI